MSTTKKSSEIMTNKKVNELINPTKPLYLIIRKCDDNYYLADETYEPLYKTPTEALVCEVTKTKKEILKDISTPHSLPKVLPDYIIQGFRNRLINETKSSLLLKYKEFEKRQGGFLDNIETIERVKERFIDAYKDTSVLINKMSDIKDLFAFAMLLQQNGAADIYFQDLFVK